MQRTPDMVARWAVVASALAVAFATLLPSEAATEGCLRRLVCGPFGGVDAALNLLLFVPLGFALSRAGVGAFVAIAIMCGATLLIEFFQLVVIPGRQASIGDLAANGLGGIVGVALSRIGPILLRPGAPTAWLLAACWLGVWFVVQVVVAYSFRSTPPSPPYFGHIARQLGPRLTAFRGAVVSAHVGAETIRNSRLTNAERVRALLARPDGTPVRALVVDSGKPAEKVEIVSLSAPRAGSVMNLDREGNSLVFGVRTAANDMRLRPFTFVLPHAFADVAPHGRTDRVALEARYTSQQVSLGAVRASGTRGRILIPRLSDGWRLLMPFQVHIGDDPLRRLASALYFAALVFPAGYWLRWALWHRVGRVAGFAAATAFLAVTAIGLTVIPLAFALRPAGWWEWAAVAGGVAAGVSASGAVLGFAATETRPAGPQQRGQPTTGR